MRSYGKSRDFLYKKTATFKERQERMATEWDVRIDVNDELTPNDICNNLREHEDELLYSFCSGVETPDRRDQQNYVASDKWMKNPSMSSENHVHLCIVLLSPLKRLDVLKLCRGQRKLGDEYCAPRNPKFTYAGWVIHHAKPGFKIDGEPLTRHERGLLPKDPETFDNAVKVVNILKKYGSPIMERRFQHFVDLYAKFKIQEKIDKLQMQMEESGSTAVAPGYIIQGLND